LTRDGAAGAAASGSDGRQDDGAAVRGVAESSAQAAALGEASGKAATPAVTIHAEPAPPPTAQNGKPGDVGKLLRGAYRQTVDEAIPDDLMDLLNKLE
jgi:hypothetical protein